ncbi:SCO family protein [Pedobacter arcticus]|uniref:SCO family protein n=1 Tax=Pedobacter arcticus TaxID=752140 RepID=UPI0002FB6329|nr:SCO family protein [Pedobacter arcticus]
MTGKKFPLGKILILVTILALPGFLYYLLQAKGKNRYKPLPVFGPKVVASTFRTKRGVKIPDTVYHKITFPQLYNSGGNTVKLDTEGQHLTVVNFFYINNKNVVPALNKGITTLQEQFKDNKRIRFISIDVDPKNDTIDQLKQYAGKIGAIPQKWTILTADTAITYPLARDQFFVNAFQPKEGEFVFSDKLILLDAENRIRGYYTGTSDDEIRRISDELKVLITEELRKVKAEF